MSKPISERVSATWITVYANEDVNDEANEIIQDLFLEQASIERRIDNHAIFLKHRVIVGFYPDFFTH